MVELLYNTDRKREAIKWTIEIRKKRGTIYSLEEGMKKLDIDVEILPWWSTKQDEFKTDKDFLAMASANADHNKSIDANKEQLIRDICHSLKPFTATFETKFMVKLNSNINTFEKINYDDFYKLLSKDEVNQEELREEIKIKLH